MFAVADENLLSGNQIRAIRLLYGFGFQRAHVRARARLRKTHGAAPLTREQFGEIHLFYFFGSERLDDGGGAGYGTAIHSQGGVASVEIFRGSHGNTLGHAHTSLFLRERQDMEASIDVSIESFVERFGDPYFMCFGVKLQSDFVTIGVGGIKLFNGDFLRQLQRILIHAAVEFLELVKPVQFLQLEHLEKDKPHIT
ncbi:MAG: hypothetical protein BWY90_01281 [Deltaproteobacteria bacterium ADurb.BinA014]|nr:MAG: hypothetical protein BWY90_01281 [Deltaproteobacteria bacterium ADurb.BinA014]